MICFIFSSNILFIIPYQLTQVLSSSYNTFRGTAFTKFHPHVCQRAVINLTRGDNSGKTKNMRRLFFHEESIHEVSRRYLDPPPPHTHTHTDKPKPICPPLFQSWGHNYDGLESPMLHTKFRGNQVGNQKVGFLMTRLIC